MAVMTRLLFLLLVVTYFAHQDVSCKHHNRHHKVHHKKSKEKSKSFHHALSKKNIAKTGISRSEVPEPQPVYPKPAIVVPASMRKHIMAAKKNIPLHVQPKRVVKGTARMTVFQLDEDQNPPIIPTEGIFLREKKDENATSASTPSVAINTPLDDGNPDREILPVEENSYDPSKIDQKNSESEYRASTPSAILRQKEEPEQMLPIRNLTNILNLYEVRGGPEDMESPEEHEITSFRRKPEVGQKKKSVPTAHVEYPKPVIVTAFKKPSKVPENLPKVTVATATANNKAQVPQSQPRVPIATATTYNKAQVREGQTKAVVAKAKTNSKNVERYPKPIIIAAFKNPSKELQSPQKGAVSMITAINKGQVPQSQPKVAVALPATTNNQGKSDIKNQADEKFVFDEDTFVDENTGGQNEFGVESPTSEGNNALQSDRNGVANNVLKAQIQHNKPSQVAIDHEKVITSVYDQNNKIADLVKENGLDLSSIQPGKLVETIFSKNEEMMKMSESLFKGADLPSDRNNKKVNTNLPAGKPLRAPTAAATSTIGKNTQLYQQTPNSRDTTPFQSSQMSLPVTSFVNQPQVMQYPEPVGVASISSNQQKITGAMKAQALNAFVHSENLWTENKEFKPIFNKADVRGNRIQAGIRTKQSGQAANPKLQMTRPVVKVTKPVLYQAAKVVNPALSMMQLPGKSASPVNQMTQQPGQLVHQMVNQPGQFVNPTHQVAQRPGQLKNPLFQMAQQPTDILNQGYKIVKPVNKAGNPAYQMVPRPGNTIIYPAYQNIPQQIHKNINRPHGPSIAFSDIKLLEDTKSRIKLKTSTKATASGNAVAHATSQATAKVNGQSSSSFSEKIAGLKQRAHELRHNPPRKQGSRNSYGWGQGHGYGYGRTSYGRGGGEAYAGDNWDNINKGNYGNYGNLPGNGPKQTGQNPGAGEIPAQPHTANQPASQPASQPEPMAEPQTAASVQSAPQPQPPAAAVPQYSKNLRKPTGNKLLSKQIKTKQHGVERIDLDVEILDKSKAATGKKVEQNIDNKLDVPKGKKFTEHSTGSGYGTGFGNKESWGKGGGYAWAGKAPPKGFPNSADFVQKPSYIPNFPQVQGHSSGNGGYSNSGGVQSTGPSYQQPSTAPESGSPQPQPAAATAPESGSPQPQSTAATAPESGAPQPQPSLASPNFQKPIKAKTANLNLSKQQTIDYKQQESSRKEEDGEAVRGHMESKNTKAKAISVAKTKQQQQQLQQKYDDDDR